MNQHELGLNVLTNVCANYAQFFVLFSMICANFEAITLGMDLLSVLSMALDYYW